VVPDASIAITKIGGLTAALTGKASLEDVTALAQQYDGKQDLIGENLTMASGLFRLSGTGGSFAIQRLVDGIYISVLILQYNSATGATRVICPAEFRPTSIGGLQELTILNTLTAREVIAQNLYSRTEVDELFGTWTYRIPDGSLAMEKVQGLVATLAAKVNRAELQNGLSDITLTKVTSGTVRVDFLDITGDTSANMIRAANIDTGTLTSGVVTCEHFTSDEIFSNEETLHLVYKDEPMAVRIGNSSARVGINCEVTQSSGLALDVNGGARFSGNLSAGSTLTVNAYSADISAIIGNDDSYLRIKNGRHFDCYRRDGSGIDMSLCIHTGNAVRVGSKLHIGNISDMSGASNYQLAVQGAGIVSDFMLCPAYRIGSDSRLKENVEDASLAECTRLVLTIRPKTYVLKETGKEQLGYIAQDWEKETQPAYRNSIVGESLGEEPMLSLDYSRVVPILHAALLSALARIEALENRLT
jgi:hypothetical protein